MTKILFRKMEHITSSPVPVMKQTQDINPFLSTSHTFQILLYTSVNFEYSDFAIQKDNESLILKSIHKTQLPRIIRPVIHQIKHS